MANYTMNCLSLPMTLDLELPSAIIRYIFKLEKGSLHLCGAGSGRARPTSFHGPGLCIMNRADSFGGLQRLVSTPGGLKHILTMRAFRKS